MSNESMRRDAWKIIRKTLKEAMPDQAVEKALRARSFTKPVTLFSIGKAGLADGQRRGKVFREPN